MMPKGAYFVNTSRGSLVNESDLIQALESGHLAGVATDVLNNEPDINESILYAYAKKSNNERYKKIITELKLKGYKCLK